MNLHNFTRHVTTARATPGIFSDRQCREKGQGQMDSSGIEGSTCLFMSVCEEHTPYYSNYEGIGQNKLVCREDGLETILA